MSQLPDDLSHAVHCATASTPLTPAQLSDTTLQEAQAQFQATMLASDLNITVAPDIVFDGKIHRFDPDGRSRTDCPGWYIAFAPDINISIHAGTFGNWRESDKGINWHESGRQISDAEAIEITRRYNEAYKKRKQEEERKQASAKKKANEIWTSSSEAPDSHPYLVSKSIKSHGVRVTSENPPRLIMPIYNGDGEIMSLQYISGAPDEKGKFAKRFLHGGKKAGGFFTINGDTSTVYVCEGYATGASIHEATGGLVVIAIDAYNLANVAPLIKSWYTKSNITFVADNDKSGVGLKKATEAAEKISARVVMPPIIGQDANDYAKQYGVDKLRELLTPSEQTSVSNNPAAMAGDYSGFAFNMDGKGSVTPISSPLPAIDASSAAMPTEIPVTQDIPAASLAMPQTPITASTPASAARENLLRSWTSPDCEEARKAVDAYNVLPPATNKNPLLKRRKLDPVAGLAALNQGEADESLVIPLYDWRGDALAIQALGPNGKATPIFGARPKEGLFFVMARTVARRCINVSPVRGLCLSPASTMFEHVTERRV